MKGHLYHHELTSKTLAVGRNNEFMVVWPRTRSEGTDGTLVFRRFDRNASPLGVARRLRGTPGSAGVCRGKSEKAPHAGQNKSLATVVVWENWPKPGHEYYPYESGRSEVCLRRFSDELKPSSHAVRISAGLGPRVSVAPNGSFVVAWEKGNHVFAQRFDAKGEAGGPRIPVTDLKRSPDPVKRFLARKKSSTPVHKSARIGMAGDGSFVIVWETVWGCRVRKLECRYYLGVYGQRFRPDGTLDGPVFVVDKRVSRWHDTRHLLDVVVFPDGRFVVAWAWRSGRLSLNMRVFRHRPASPDKAPTPITRSASSTGRVSAR